jgi:hypothetical protein
MHLGRPDLIHSHRGPSSENGHGNKRLGCSSVLYVTRLRLAEEVICYARSEQTCELLLWETSLFGKLLEGGSCL